MNFWQTTKLLFAVSIILSLSYIPVQGSTTNLSALKDNTLYEEAAGVLSNAVGDYFFAGRTSQPSNSIRRGVIAFDIAPAIPLGAVILDVQLKLHMSKSSFGPTLVELHGLKANWGEGTSNAPGEEGGGAVSTANDATWIHTFYNANFWSTAGGDFDSIASSSTVIDSAVGFYTFPSTPELVGDAQNWLDNPGSNFGWLVLGDESTAGTSKRFDSRENPTAANRPVLIVTYAIPSQLTITANKDNTLYEDAGGEFSNGAGTYFFVGRTNQATNYLRRGVLAFDVSGNIPGGSLITGAQLKLNMSKTVSDTFPISVYKLQADWGEGTSDALANEGQGAPSTLTDATWIHTFYNSSFWTNSGGDYDSASHASTIVTGFGSYTFGSTPQLTGDVQDWLDNPANNFGWILIGDEATPASAKRFDSRQNSIVGNRPKLIVYYVPPPCCIGNRGDINHDGTDANILDLTYLVDRIFRSGPQALCAVEADLNNDGTPSNILDLTFLVDRIFRGGPPPGPC